MVKGNKYSINLALFKCIGFYQMVDPNCAKVFGYNAYVVVNVLFIAFTTTVIATGLSGIFRDGHVSSDNGGLHAYMKPLFFVGCVTVGNLKTYIVVRNADRVRALFGVADQSFLLGGRRQPIHPKLVSSGRRFNRLIFPWYFLTFFITALLWITIPIVVNNCGQHPADGAWIRKNVINFWYPVTADTYDRFYYVFYAAEGLMVVYSTYVLVAFDLFLIAILQLMAAQYEIMSAAYERLDFKNGNKHGIKRNDDKTIEKTILSVTLDCQRIYTQLKILHDISRPIVLIYMANGTLGMITVPYIIVEGYVQNGYSFLNSDIFASVWTLFCTVITTYMYCTKFQNVTERKEAVNFGIYCSDWTSLDIRIKKHILLIMKINNSNNLKVNVTPTTSINLPLFATIVRISYSITSVLIKSNISNM